MKSYESGLEKSDRPVSFVVGTITALAGAGICAALYVNADGDANAKLSRQAAAIQHDGFTVVGMPKSFWRDVFGDASKKNEVETIIGLGGCKVGVTASQETDPASGSLDVVDYVFIIGGGDRVTVQSSAELAERLGPDPCAQLAAAIPQ